jgi:alpha-galactosidase
VKTHSRLYGLVIVLVISWTTGLCFAGPAPNVVFIPGQSVRYESAGVCYSESLESGLWRGTGWSCDGRSVPEPWKDPISAFRLDVRVDPAVAEPIALDGGWRWVREEQHAGELDSQLTATVELASSSQSLTVNVKTLLDGTPVITRWLEIKNNSDHPIAISSLMPWQGRLWEGDATVRMGHSTRWHVPWEGWFGWNKVVEGINLIENRQGLVWDDPFFVLHNEERADYFFGQLAWPTNYRIEIKKDSGITFAAGPIAVNELRVLDPGETISSPGVHIGYVHGSFDESVQAMHKHIRRSVIPEQDPERSYRIQCLFPEDQPLSLLHREECNEDNLTKFLEVCAECGIELFILDGPTWARGYGDWIAKEAWFPNGLDALIQNSKAKGILFGVYAEVEGGRGDWKNTRAYKDHPEWFLFRNPDYPAANLINIANHSAASYVEEDLGNLLSRYPLDIYRHDQNGCFGNEGSVTRRHGFLENDYWRYYDNWHGIVDRARGKDKKRIFQQASGSGSRLELETIAHWNENYTSDRVSYPYVFQMASGLSVYLPPEILVTPFGMAGPDQPDSVTILRGAFALGQVPLLFNAMLPKTPEELTPEIKERMLHYTNLYKSFIRPMLHEVKVFHHEPVNSVGGVESSGWFAMEFSSPDRKKGWATIVSLRGDKRGQYLMKPRGLDADKNYTVKSDNQGTSTITKGIDLLNKGLQINIPENPRSELLLFEEISNNNN